MTQFLENQDLPKTYDPKAIDKKWYAFWEQHSYFEADPASEKPPYCIVMPPPNVTGNLHVGHALGNTIQDLLVRWKRMLGFEALWVPGTDHAGIATQTVVERHLFSQTGKRRRDFSREEFLSHVWKWKEDNQDNIINQQKKLGCSCDWSRHRFTMDPENNRAVRKIFKKMYDDGLIYRGDYLVNWDPVTETALADDEVEHEDKESFLWYFNYPIENSAETLTIATTRPETMLGDVAVAVNPKDTRYEHLIGKHVLLPIQNRPIPIIADAFVDIEFGTGAVKVTPAHDPNDYEIGMRHDLPMINIMTPNGRINENGAPFTGMTMADARTAVINAMESSGLLEKIEPHSHRVGISYRSKAVIEPYLSKQWFVKMSAFKTTLRKAVEESEVLLIPKNWENTYFHWIDNLRDWCISRQLWWGHRIPIWYNKQNPEEMICFDAEGIPEEIQKNPDDWYQDEDVLDTWFSSALWPFTALGWPEKTEMWKRFYPNSALITGHDILFFWVARMILMGKYTLDEVPFHEVYLHSLIFGKSYWKEDAEGQIQYIPEKERVEYDLGKPVPKDVRMKWEKMSKSKGNIIDPLEMIEQYGTDAVRMALTASATHSWQIDLDRRRFEDYKNFANKIWNGARFVLMNLLGEDPLTEADIQEGLNDSKLTLADRWILCRLNRTIVEVNKALSLYEFDRAATLAYEFYWKEFCAYYVEIAKPTLFGKVGEREDRKNCQKVLAYVLLNAVQLIHPMAPFITEELFQQIKSHYKNLPEIVDKDSYTERFSKAIRSSACIVSPYPTLINAQDVSTNVETTFNFISEIIYAIRNIRGEMKIPLQADVDVYIVGADSSIVKDNLSLIEALNRRSTLRFATNADNLGLASHVRIGDLEVVIPMSDEFKAQERVRLEKEKLKTVDSIEKMKKQLSNEDFISRAPKELVESKQLLLEKAVHRLEEINQKLPQLV
ncbi:MAG: valine--tRNA ligase [Waddliaceae bacterium]